MKGTAPKDMRHVCRKCGEMAPTHAAAVKHWNEHGFWASSRCNSNCGLKMTYHELRAGRALYGEGVR